MKFVELTESEVRGLEFDCQNFLQSWEMYQRYQQLGREAYFVGVKNDDKILAAGLILGRPWHFGRKTFRVPGGWLMDYDASNRLEILQFLTNSAREFCRAHQGIALEISPNIISQPRDIDNQVIEGKDNLAVKADLERLGFKYLGEHEQVKWTFTLDLINQTMEHLFRDLRTGHRQRIHRAERGKVRIRELNIDELDILKTIAAETGKRQGFQDPELAYYRSMKQAFGDKAKFIVAEIPAENLAEADRTAQDGEYVPLAAAMFIKDPHEIIYLYGGSVRRLQKYGGAHIIQWQMIQEAIDAGCRKYNFYGVKPVEGNGVYRFKTGFRGQVDELLGSFVLPLNFLGKLYCLHLRPHLYGKMR